MVDTLHFGSNHEEQGTKMLETSLYIYMFDWININWHERLMTKIGIEESKTSLLNKEWIALSLDAKHSFHNLK